MELGQPGSESVGSERRRGELLPPTYAVRWGLNRKAQVVDAIESGLLRLEEALERYRMSVEEYHSWRRDVRQRRARKVRDALVFKGRRAHQEARPPVGRD